MAPDFSLIADKWMPPDMFILHGHEQFVCYKGGKVQVFTDREMIEIYNGAITEFYANYNRQSKKGVNHGRQNATEG